MIALSLLFLSALLAPTLEQSTSPCPNVFTYEQTGTEPGRWYGTVNLSTDSTLHSLWLNVVLDSKADILGNWVGDVSTNDNIDFKIENTKMKIQPGPAVAVRFFVQYNPLNKVPRLQAIKLNGREICNANTPQPANSRPEEVTVRPAKRPETTQETRPEVRPETRPETRPVARPNERPTETWPVDSRPNSQGSQKPSTASRPSEQGPVYRPSSQQQGNVSPFSIGGGQPGAQAVTDRNKYQLTTVKTPIRDDDDDSDVADPDDYFTGGHLLVASKPTNNQGNRNPDYNHSAGDQCGKVTRNNPNPLVVNGKPTLEGQWPWQIALYQTQTIDSKYICGGTLVSHKHIITAAHCVTKKGRNKVVNKNTLTVYLGKHNLRTSVEGVEIRLVSEIKVHPQYNASSFSKDLSILTLRQPVDYTDFVRAACLWPEQQVDLSHVIGKKGSVVGWGFDDTGMATEELALVEMPVVDQETCIRSYSEFFARFTSEYTFCAGYRDGATDENTGVRKSTSVCNGDSGGGMVFFMRDSWYLRGLVSLSVARQNEYRCDPTHYVVFTDLAKFLPWIRQQISN
ncbi:serine protease gd-like isoform X2 [Aricia agestis]|uniref:serine protease gd-like isoform X2 n=1 Tax=Aricia agestis TaxID=91739 RepID=UPI001C201DB7|nr:serine protease gd-like isoform X2 [Aricia agestis]